MKKLKQNLQNKGKKIKTKLKSEYFQRKVLIFMFFLFLSTIFWFLNALNKEYQTEISIKLNYIGFNKEDNQAEKKQFTEQLKVKLNAKGFSLLNYNFTGKDKFNIYRKGNYIKTRDSLHLYLLTKDIKNQISNNIGNEIKINQIMPDTIQIKYERIYKKKLPVFARVEIQTKQQFFQSAPIKIMPDSIWVFGSKSSLKKINKVYTQSHTFKALNKSFTANCQLDKKNGLKFEQDEVKLIISIEEFTEKKLIVPILVINEEEGVFLQTFPEHVTVIFNVGTSNYLKIKKKDFQFTVDYNEIKENSNKLKVKLVAQPENIMSVKYLPLHVEFLVEK